MAITTKAFRIGDLAAVFYTKPRIGDFLETIEPVTYSNSSEVHLVNGQVYAQGTGKALSDNAVDRRIEPATDEHRAQLRRWK